MHQYNRFIKKTTSQNSGRSPHVVGRYHECRDNFSRMTMQKLLCGSRNTTDPDSNFLTHNPLCFDCLNYWLLESCKPKWNLHILYNFDFYPMIFFMHSIFLCHRCGRKYILYFSHLKPLFFFSSKLKDNFCFQLFECDV